MLTGVELKGWLAAPMEPEGEVGPICHLCGSRRGALGLWKERVQWRWVQGHQVCHLVLLGLLQGGQHILEAVILVIDTLHTELPLGGANL